MISSPEFVFVLSIVSVISVIGGTITSIIFMVSCNDYDAPGVLNIVMIIISFMFLVIIIARLVKDDRNVLPFWCMFLPLLIISSVFGIVVLCGYTNSCNTMTVGIWGIVYLFIFPVSPFVIGLISLPFVMIYCFCIGLYSIFNYNSCDCSCCKRYNHKQEPLLG